MAQSLQQQLLQLQRMEMALIRAVIAHPHSMPPADYQRLRYLLGMARLTRFVPGAALGQPRGAEVQVAPTLIEPLRREVLKILKPALRSERRPRERLHKACRDMPALLTLLQTTRPKLLQLHASDFSAADLDAECGVKALVSIWGGGGGAGYVYAGAAARLRSERAPSRYIVGTSIGALLGAFFAREQDVDVEALLAWGKGLQMRELFARPKASTTYTLPGLMRLHLKALEQVFRHADGTALRIKDMAIPYEAVTAGMRAKVYNRLPGGMQRMLQEPAQHKTFSQNVAERMLGLTAFVSPNIVEPVVLGRDDITREARVVDAVGLSAAIPGILQYAPGRHDARTDGILDGLREQRDLALFVDGAMASNVPARIAWEGVQAGKIGTRNAFYLALDCFAPQWDTHHLWLGPIQQIIQLQLRSQRDYFDWLLRFQPTLSPVNLLPSDAEFDQAYTWGWKQADVMIPFLNKALEVAEYHPA